MFKTLAKWFGGVSATVIGGLALWWITQSLSEPSVSEGKPAGTQPSVQPSRPPVRTPGTESGQLVKESMRITSMQPPPPARRSIRAKEGVELTIAYRVREAATLELIVLDERKHRIGGLDWQAKDGTQVWTGPAGRLMRMKNLRGSGTLRIQFNAVRGPANVAFLRCRILRGKQDGQLIFLVDRKAEYSFS